MATILPGTLRQIVSESFNGSPPAACKATTPAAGGITGGNFGLGESPLLTVTTHRDLKSAAASVAEKRTLRRGPVGPNVTVSKTRCPALELQAAHFLSCRNRNPFQPSRSIGFHVRPGGHIQYDSYKRHGRDIVPCFGSLVDAIEESQPFAESDRAPEV